MRMNESERGSMLLYVLLAVWLKIIHYEALIDCRHFSWANELRIPLDYANMFRVRIDWFFTSLRQPLRCVVEFPNMIHNVIGNRIIESDWALLKVIRIFAAFAQCLNITCNKKNESKSMHGKGQGLIKQKLIAASRACCACMKESFVYESNAQHPQPKGIINKPTRPHISASQTPSALTFSLET